MSDPRCHAALFVDLDALSRSFPPEQVPAISTLGPALLRYVAGAGRPTLARAYADWTKRPPQEARDANAAHLVPVLTVEGAGGECRTPVRLAVDALEARYAGGEPDAIVIASGDTTLLPLVQALRADGAHVTLVVPAAAAADELRTEADAVATLEDVLAGAVAAPVVVRPPPPDEEEEEAEEPPPPARERRFSGGPRESRGGFDGGARGRTAGWGAPSHGGMSHGGMSHGGAAPGGGLRWSPSAPAGPVDFSRYDWAPFVRLIDELEHRLPFVGVRYLVNKVLGPRNCGIDDPRQKRDLINRAVDDGLIEMYEVGNVGERRDPVTACRLDRRNAVVVSVLGADTTSPAVAAGIAVPGMDDGDDDGSSARERVDAELDLREGD
jgi:hypothetical protein